MTSPPQPWPDFFAALQKRTGGDLRTDDYSRLLYSSDASLYQVVPPAVFLPRTADELQAAVELAAEYRLPLLPRTAGSSLAGQAVNDALILDISRHLDRVIELNVEERWVRVQPGIVLDELNLHLRPHGLQFGPDPASSNRACLGGIVANNATGSHSILYGMTADHLLATNVILSNGRPATFTPLTNSQLRLKLAESGLEGEIYRGVAQIAAQQADVIRAGTPRHWRRCGGYNLDRFIDLHGTQMNPDERGYFDDGVWRPTPGSVSFKWPGDGRFNLAKLVCGSEGTLAVMQDITLNLVPLPQMTGLAIIHFDSLRQALAAVPLILEVEPTAVELLDNLGLTLCRNVPEYGRLLATFIQGQPFCLLIAEFQGSSGAELRARIAQLDSHLQQQGVGHTAVTVAVSPQSQQNVWTVRKVGLGLLMGVRSDYKPIPFIEDAAVPVEHLAEYVLKVEEFCQSLGTEVTYYAHASAGCIHMRPLINSKLAEEVAKLPQIVNFSVDLLHGYGGVLSSEHGDGRARSWANERFFGPELYRLYQEVKRLFDRHNLLNPGNIVNGRPMTENLRYGEGYRVVRLTEHLDFHPEQGLHRAVEMCNGAGVCRKKTTGTMCPSFMVTREEEHSTRGRANALRAVLSGQLPAAELTSRRMYEVMDLCIECKACKAECPSAVDMAKIKFEFLAHYYAAHGVPLRARLLASIGQWAPLAAGPLAPLTNWTTRNRPLRALMEKWVALSRQRPLPQFAHQPFHKWFAAKRNGTRIFTDEHGLKSAKICENPRSSVSDSKRVVLFVDTLNNYAQPEIPIAAVELLETAGYRIILAPVTDDGRAYISKGLVKQARETARKVVTQLAPYAAQGLPIVGLEPSSLLSLRDEYLYLLPDDPWAAQVAQRALLFEELIAQLVDAGRLNLTFTDEPRQILLHGHCHQKALVGSGPTIRALSLPPNYTVTEVDSGCCGMAGSFGYEAEHYELSLKMGERRLLPAVRQASLETIIAAPGVSCRQQIEHGSGREARHPAQILRDALL
jgi:FAD/FMN-containing dehydrogenase/Fe-S oxidoreductase